MKITAGLKSRGTVPLNKKNNPKQCRCIGKVDIIKH
jgi:hypothetical protein